jgi:hypothetical protein
MDFLYLIFTAALALHFLRSRDQQRRIALLGKQLGQYQIEKMMETLTQGYLRALGESEPERREQVWNYLATTEQTLCDQFNRFVADVDKLDPQLTRVNKTPLPLIERVWPAASFDLRAVLRIHAQGLFRAAQNTEGRSARDKAFVMSAELFLMQHTCHWFCKTKTTASARLLVRHQTPYAKVLASVSPETRTAYLRLLAGH